MRTTLLSFLLLSASLLAQTAVTTPNPMTPQNLDRPFPGGIGHYQQWYSANGLTGGFTTPVRIEQLEFFAGSTNSSNATTIDMEVWMGHGNGLGLTGTFLNNFSSTPVVVLPRTQVQLSAVGPGQVAMTIPFINRFTWDHTRPIVIDIQIFGNSRGNQSFLYEMRGTTVAGGRTHRSYVAGSATGTTGTVQANIGLVTRFTGRPGVVIDFGAGCPGEGGFIPRNASMNIPYPGVVWNNRLSNAPSQRLCALMLGTSNTSTSSSPPIALPTDLGAMLGIGATGCMLHVDPAAILWTQTVGGGPGAGAVTMSLQMPAMTWYIGLSLYTQWIVSDLNSPSGVMAMSQGVWSIVAPVGG